MDKIINKISDTITHITWLPNNNEYMICKDSIDFTYHNRTLMSQSYVEFIPKTVYRYTYDGEPVIKTKMTANGEVSYIENEIKEPCATAFSINLSFNIGTDELLLGLGQYEDGIFDYRNKTEYLYESNMRIAIPFLITTGGYAILIESESNMIFKSEKNSVVFNIDTADKLSYYVFLGDNIPSIIKTYLSVTGGVSLLPRWCFGYIQSKERYKTGQELEDTVALFRELNIPIDCIVQDWYTWEEGLWGEKKLDKKRFPNFPQTIKNLHDNNVHLMVSIWPNMSSDSTNYSDFKSIGQLLPNSNLYNVYNDEAREQYWEQIEDEIFTSGTDALWCDNAEPFSDADWNGEFKRCENERYKLVTDLSKKSIEWTKLNSYGLYHAKGIYENWLKAHNDKRVVNLTRSGYYGCQQYGTILWSGDITATWSTLRKQITEGLKISLCGFPYWTLDIGGFFVVDDKYDNRGCNDTEHKPLWFWKGDYNEGINDLGYRELYVRWLQFGTFLPIFRSHGTDTPREPWNFGEPGTIFYDTITKFIRLRYQLLPYIYSLGAKAHYESEMIMRSLVIDYPNDPECRLITDEYMFGDALLVAPVYTPMYYDVNSRQLNNTNKTRKVYLPKDSDWYDFYNNQYYKGGIYIDADAKLEKIPLFVKAGSIIPLSSPIQYSDEKNGQPEIINVYEGADGKFTLYNDSGDGFDYENGDYSAITFAYDDNKRQLSVESLKGNNSYASLAIKTQFITYR